MIETEIRGVLDSKEYDMLIGIFEKSGTFKKEFIRLNLMYGAFNPESEIDFRCRVSENEAELVLKKGKPSLFIERRSVADLVKWFQDFYMFDSKIVMNIIYDEKVEGKYLGAEELITDPKEVSRYVNLRNKMVKAAVPMEDFLKQHNIPLDNIF